MSQIVYYFSSAIALGAPKQKLNFTVPTGNFGDIFAGYVAKKMGLPIEKLIIASNQNDILHRTLTNGVYSKEGLKQTISPSMDIQVASNFERLLFELYDGQCDIVQNAMKDLSNNGKFKLSSNALRKMGQDFLSGSASEKITSGTIKKTLIDFGRLVCPHTSVGLAVANELLESQGISTMVTLATAHPAKFPEAVEEYTGVTPKLPQRYNELFSKHEMFTLVKNNFSEITKIISKRTSV
jgi:threonine synthase